MDSDRTLEPPADSTYSQALREYIVANLDEALNTAHLVASHDERAILHFVAAEQLSMPFAMDALYPILYCLLDCE
jgi:hypothetical protein